MCTEKQLSNITKQIALLAKTIFRDNLEATILYGAYAKDNSTPESAVNIMILVNLPREELPFYKKSFILLASELGLQYDVFISVILKDTETFNKYSQAISLYADVKRDGIIITV